MSCCGLGSALAAAGGVPYAGDVGPVGNLPGDIGTGLGNTVGSGAFSGMAGAQWGTFAVDLGSGISNVVKSIEGPQVTNLGNGQVLLPSGQVVNTLPSMFQSGSGMMLLVAAGAVILVLVLVMRK